MPFPMLLRNVTLWTDRYCMLGPKATLPCVPPSLRHAYPPKYDASCHSEQSLVLHISRNGVERMLSRALNDAEVWKERAIVMLKELRAIQAKK
jgi:hypothetical protein